MPVHPLYRLIVRATAAALVAGTLFFLLSRAVLPDGRLSVTSDLVHPAPYISSAKPAERIALPEKGESGLPTMIGDPLYVDVTPPSRFDTVTLALRYRNTGHPLVELGALASPIEQLFTLAPAQNLLLDRLSWQRVSSGDLTLLQREKRYASIDEFFRDPPSRDRLAVYRAAAGVPYVLPGYEPSASTREIEISLRGHHRLLTYVKDEPLSITFVVQDMNRQEGADPIIVTAYREDSEEPLARTVLVDDGNTKDDQRSSKLRNVPMTIVAPEEGFYQIEFTAPADVFIRKIVTRQRKLVFKDKIYFGDHVGFSDKTPPAVVYVGGRRMVARTAHAESLQRLTIGSDSLTLAEPHVRYIRELRGTELRRVVAPKRDLLLEADGLFALSQDEYFDPQAFALQWYTTTADLDARGIDYVLTSYESPSSAGDFLETEATFRVPELAKTKEGAYRFVITAPGISETRHALDIASLTVTMRRQPVTWRNALPRFFGIFTRKEAAAPAVVPGGRTYGESPP